MSKAIRVSDASPSLPEDMVAEILRWLPVESVLSFKCVCKKWRNLIQQDDFIEKHHRHRAAMDCHYKKKYINQFCSGFSCIDIQEGLMLEQEHRKDPTGRLRIRNPATMQTVYLPDLRVGNESPPWVVARMFFVAKSINECTVISFSESEESVLSGRFRAVTVGVDAAWRPLKNSPPNSIHSISNAGQKPKIYALSIQNIFYVITANDKKILWVDAENESIKTTKIPEDLFSDWWCVLPGEWNSKLSLSRRELFNSDEITIWVLMNNNKNEWANFKTQTADLATLTQDYPISHITKQDEKTWMMVIYGIQWRMKKELSINPSILHLKGMQSILHLKGMQSENEGDRIQIKGRFPRKLFL